MKYLFNKLTTTIFVVVTSISCTKESDILFTNTTYTVEKNTSSKLTITKSQNLLDTPYAANNTHNKLDTPYVAGNGSKGLDSAYMTNVLIDTPYVANYIVAPYVKN